MAAARAVRDDDGTGESSAPDAAPASFSELCGWIERRKAGMPKRLREVAAFVLAYPDEIAFGPLAKLADSARLPPSAFVRFAQTMGYRGFSELQAVIRGRLIAPKERWKSQPGDEVLSRCVREAQHFLGRLEERTSRSMVSRGARILAGAETVFLLGQNDTALAALHLGHALTAEGIRNVTVCAGPGAPDATLAFGSAHDAAIVADLTSSDRTIAAQAADLASRDVPLILFTDSRLHPLASPDVPCFEVLDGAAISPFRYAALGCLINALTAEMHSLRRATPAHLALAAAVSPPSGRSAPRPATRSS